MKKSVLLILLLCWNHVCGNRLRCSTGVAITNHTISLLSSTNAGAKVFLLRNYQAHSLTECLNDCCSEKHGLCSVAEYRNNSEDANCVHFSCEPILKCKFMDAAGTDTFTFPFVPQDQSATNNAGHRYGQDYNKVKDTVLEESATIHHPQHRTFKDHTRAVSARKGVETFTTPTNNEGSSASTKEVSESYLENGGSSKSLGHSRTVVARKGVESIATNNEDSLVSPKGTYTPYLENGGSSKSLDRTRTVVARKGVESTNGDSLVSWKGSSTTYLVHGDSLNTVTMEDVFSKTESSLKNDNTTIKPRKGVDSEAVKIKARKGVEAMHSSVNIDTPEISRSKVKPRKGAVMLPLAVTTAPIMNATTPLESVPESNSVSTAFDTNVTNFRQILPSHSTLSTDLISMLEQVFRDESPSPGRSLKSHYGSPTLGPSASNSFTKIHYGSPTLGPSASNSFTISSTPVSSVKYKEYATLPLNSAVTDHISASGVTDSSVMPFHTVLPSKSSGHHENVLESTPSLATLTEHVKHQPVSASHVSAPTLNPSHIPLLHTSMNSHYSIASDDSKQHDSSVLVFSISAPNKTKMAAVSTTDDSESERKYKSSMHLLLSLIFGLLVLFVVLGAVAKRVYDVWMRRHYHRMDFLIDGMYDGYS